MTTEKHQCEKNIWSDWSRGSTCSRTGSVERNGKWYCKQHDPVAIAEKTAAKNAAWQQRMDRVRAENERRDRIVALAEKAGHKVKLHAFDGAPRVVEGSNGAYVQTWVWLDFTGTELAKGNTPDAKETV